MTDDSPTETTETESPDDEADFLASRRELVQFAAVAAMVGDGVAAPTIAEWREALAGGGTPGVARALPRKPSATLTGPGGGRFGTAVDLAGDTAVVGLPPDVESPGPTTGRAAVFTSRSGTWSRAATLAPRAETAGGEFGAAVAADVDTVVVGAPLSGVPNGPHGGSVTVFARRDGEWQHAASLTAPATDGVDRFGSAVDIDTDTALVGAPQATSRGGSGSGATAVYTRDSDGWVRSSTLLAPTSGLAAFGRSVALAGDLAVIGARTTAEWDGRAGGLVVVYRRSHGVWTRAAILRPPSSDDSPASASADGFGKAIAVDGSGLLVGAPDASTGAGRHAGAAYVFAESAGRWRHQATLQAPDGGADHRFATSVGLDGPIGIVGTAFDSGPVVFGRSGAAWRPEPALTTASAAAGTETAVDIEGGTALVGVPRPAPGTGHAGGVLEVYEP